MVALFAFLEKRQIGFALALAAIPYMGLRLYLSGVMHAGAETATVPSATFLLSLLVVGALVPAAFLVLVLRRLVAEKDSSLNSRNRRPDDADADRRRRLFSSANGGDDNSLTMRELDRVDIRSLFSTTVC